MEKTKHELRVEAMHLLYQQDLREDLIVEPFKVGFELYQGVMDHLSEIDTLIKDNLFNYSIERLSFVDRAIIRLAVYEIKYTDTPNPVVINEAVRLTKKFSNLDDEKQSAFTNKLLDTIAKRVG